MIDNLFRLKSEVMNAIVICEESQEVTKELRRLGHNAFSNDMQACSGGHPEWHFQGDCFEFLNRPWDLIIAHPPCTYLTNSGVRWLYNEDGSKNVARWLDLIDSMRFFNRIKQEIKKVGKGAIENPIPHKWARDGFFWEGEWIEGIGSPGQIIQPYQFGHTEQKGTCFWLFGLNGLVATNNVFRQMKALPKNQQNRIHSLPPSPERSKLRSKTFSGVAQAMASQWAGSTLD